MDTASTNTASADGAYSERTPDAPVALDRGAASIVHRPTGLS